MTIVVPVSALGRKFSADLLQELGLGHKVFSSNISMC